MGGRCETRCYQTSPVLELEADQAQWNNLDAEIVGGLRSSRGFIATGWMADLKSCTVFVCNSAHGAESSFISRSTICPLSFHPSPQERTTDRNFLVATDPLLYLKSLIIARALYSICFPTRLSVCAL
jgi:hypothetical protein